MNSAEFVQLVRAFLARTRPGRHLYVWSGDEDSLLSTLRDSVIHHLDLYTVAASLAQLPSDDEAARRLLRRAIIARLDELMQTECAVPQILVVTGHLLLLRYGLGLTAFYDHFVSDCRMVILQVPNDELNVATVPDLPDYICFQPGADIIALQRMLERPEHLITK